MGEADGTNGSGGASPGRRLIGARRYAPLVLVAGAAVAAFVLLPAVPRDVEVSFHLDDRAISALEVGWFEHDHPDALQAASWTFANGAPASVTETVHLTRGRYDVEVTFDRGNGRETKRRSVQLQDDGAITIRVP